MVPSDVVLNFFLPDRPQRYLIDFCKHSFSYTAMPTVHTKTLLFENKKTLQTGGISVTMPILRFSVDGKRSAELAFVNDDIKTFK